MTFREKLEEKVIAKNIPYIFCKEDLKNKDFTEDEISRISNFDKKNTNTTNENKKVLISRKIYNEIYYSFDKELVK